MAEEKENVEEKKSCTAIRSDLKRKTEEKADEEIKENKVLYTITTTRRELRFNF